MPNVTYTGVDIIEAMPRNAFYQQFVKRVCKEKTFGELYCFGAENLAPQKKLEVRNLLANNGISLDMTSTDSALDEIASAVSARAVSLR